MPTGKDDKPDAPLTLEEVEAKLAASESEREKLAIEVGTLKVDLAKAKSKDGSATYTNFDGSVKDKVKDAFGRLDQFWNLEPIKAQRGLDRLKNAATHVLENCKVPDDVE